MTTESELKQQMTRYLLGELSDAEQAALEQRYFTDPRAFTQLSEIETDLADDYARGQLTTAQRLRFEQHYLANPHLRERVEIAQSLQDHFQPPKPIPQREPAPARSSFWAWFTRPAVVGSLATASLILAAMSFLWWREAQRLRHELATAQAMRQQAENDRSKLEIQLAEERTRITQSSTDLAQAQSANKPAFVTLLLSATSTRETNTSQAPRLNIPAEAKRVRVQLTVPATDEYRSYRVLLQSVDGTKLWQRQNLKPRRLPQSAIFSFEIPADLFRSTDYVITLTGLTGQGDADEISHSLFRVTKN